MGETKRKRRYFCSACGDELTVDHMDHTTAVSPCENPLCSSVTLKISTPRIVFQEKTEVVNQRLEVAIKRLDHQREKISQLFNRINRLEEHLL